ADQARADDLADGLDDRAMGVAGDDRGGGGLAVAHVAAVGVDGDHHVLDGVDGAQGGPERGLQRHPQHAEPDVGDLHGRIRWMLVMRSTVGVVALDIMGSTGVTTTPLSGSRSSASAPWGSQPIPLVSWMT